MENIRMKDQWLGDPNSVLCCAGLLITLIGRNFNLSGHIYMCFNAHLPTLMHVKVSQKSVLSLMNIKID